MAMYLRRDFGMTISYVKWHAPWGRACLRSISKFKKHSIKPVPDLSPSGTGLQSSGQGPKKVHTSPLFSLGYYPPPGTLSQPFLKIATETVGEVWVCVGAYTAMWQRKNLPHRRVPN